MTKNSYEDPKKNSNFGKSTPPILRTQESPQITKKFQTEDTPQSKDAIFDAAFRCAMAEAGLPSDPILAN